MLTARTVAACAAGVAVSASICARASAGADTLLATFEFEGETVLSEEWRPFIAHSGAFLDGAVLNLFHVAGGTRLELTGDFAEFNALATDGTDQFITVGLLVAGLEFASQTTEAVLLANATFAAPGVGDPDFAGFTITRIEVLGTGWQQRPNDRMFASVEFSVYGVPSPGAGVALGMAGVFGMGRRRR